MSNNETHIATEVAPITFHSFNLAPNIVKAIDGMGYVTPTPIQEKAIPLVLSGHDLMGAAQTGTGKTAAFALPILHRLMPHATPSPSPAKHPVRALILAPTRELADQIFENVRQYCAHTDLRATVVFGGVDMKPQSAAIRAGVEVLVATPGRLLDHIESKTLNLSQVSALVLDEADRMLDMGFMPDLLRIVQLLPKTRQTLMFSATFSDEIRRLAGSFLTNPITVEVARRNESAANVTQQLITLESRQKEVALVDVLKKNGGVQTIVFLNSKLGCARLTRYLQREGLKAEAIHGDKSQQERLKTLNEFKANTVDILVATDVAARGLDIAELPCVINYDVPYHAEDYVHRIGRTGRAGASGAAYTFVTPDEEKLVADVEKLIARKIDRKPWQEERAERAPRQDYQERQNRQDRQDRPQRTPEEDKAWREARERRAARSDSGKSTRTHEFSGTAFKASSDPFFSQPYVAVETPVVDANAPVLNPTAQRGNGLLGKKVVVKAALFGAR